MMHRTPRTGRQIRAAIAREAAGLAPAVTDELQRQALAALTAWCSRPRRRRNTVVAAWWLLGMIEQSARLDRMLDAAIRATVITMHEQA